MEMDDDASSSTIKRGSATPGPPDTPSSTTGPLSSRSAQFPAAHAQGTTFGHGPGGGGRSPALATPHQDAQSLAAAKRKRGAGIVTPNACTECRKKRAKCDGQKPCARCRSLGADCVYEIPMRQSKETLRNEIDTLRRQQRSNEQIFSALVRSDLGEEILSRLRNGQTTETISEWLSQSLPAGTGTGTSRRGDGGEGGGALGTGHLGHTLGLPLSLSGRQAGVPHVASYRTDQESHVSRTGYGPTSGPASGPTSGRGPQSTSVTATASPASISHVRELARPQDTRSPWAAQFSPQTTPTVEQQQHQQHHQQQQAVAMDWTPEGKQGSMLVDNWDAGDNKPDRPRYPGMDQILSPEVPETKVAASAWTKITDDSRLVHHLLALYFCWEYPTFASLSKEHFLKDFQDGRTRFCSSMLVNALLALGCRFSSQPNTRAKEDDLYSSGDHFFRESLRLYREEEDHHSLTTIQALGIMAIREASCGRDSESWYYSGQSMRLALEMGLQRVTGDAAHDDELAVQSATFWGAFALDQYGRLSLLPLMLMLLLTCDGY